MAKIEGVEIPDEKLAKLIEAKRTAIERSEKGQAERAVLASKAKAAGIKATEKEIADYIKKHPSKQREIWGFTE
jgi:uncharacterized protein YcaQ